MGPILNIQAYAFEYQLSVHLVGILGVIAMFLASGVGMTIKIKHTTRFTIPICLIFLLSQIPITLIRMNSTFFHESSLIYGLADHNREIYMSLINSGLLNTKLISVANPFSKYINFLWSPMATVALIWLYFSHLVSSCKNCNTELNRACIDPSPHFKSFGIALLTGIGTSFIVYEVFIVRLAVGPHIAMKLLLGVSLAFVPLELIYKRSKYNKVSFFNHTWAWFTGTWLFYLAKV